MPEAIAAAAPERVRDELIRMLVSEKPSQGLHLLRKTGLLACIIPELAQAEMGKGRVVDQAAPDAALRLSALFCAPVQSPSPDHGKKCGMVAESIMHRLCFSKSMIRKVVRLVEEEYTLAGYDPAWSDGTLRRLIRRTGAENLETLLALRKANLAGPAKGTRESLRRLTEVQRRIMALIRAPFVKGPQDLAIDGSMVMEIKGLSPGPEVGLILRRLSEELMDHPEWNTRTRLVAMVKRMRLPALPEHSEVFGELHRTAGPLKTKAQPES